MRCTAFRVLKMDQYRLVREWERVRTTHNLIFGRAGRCKAGWYSKGRSIIPSALSAELPNEMIRQLTMTEIIKDMLTM
jgi:hypothetical protein